MKSTVSARMTRWTSQARSLQPFRRLRHYLPNRCDGTLALVSTLDPDFQRYAPVRMTQIIGGRRWSLSIVQTGSPRRRDGSAPAAGLDPSVPA